MKEIGIGVIGCGGFGYFAMEQFSEMPGVELVAIAEPNPSAGVKAIHRFDISLAESVDALCNRSDVDLIYIATPPYLHHQHTMIALRADKHVVCEKPLAITLDEADEMLSAGKAHKRIVVTNLMQRYNPLTDAVKELIDEGILGDLLHGYFENYASDEHLCENHWFWDPAMSGGIFVEHGVHFFDLFDSWLGAGEVLHAYESRRCNGVVDQVQCGVRYRDDVVINFYHGFHQIDAMDRQELRLVFERGDVKLLGWIPTEIEINAVADDANQERLSELFPDGKLQATERYRPFERRCHGRNKAVDIEHKIRLIAGEESLKMDRYGELVRALMEDQLLWITNPSHQRRVTEANGRESLRMAIWANELASLKTSAQRNVAELSHV